LKKGKVLHLESWEGKGNRSREPIGRKRDRLALAPRGGKKERSTTHGGEKEKRRGGMCT